ncbi:MAG: hypothetical protein MJA27_28795 [Pseudanabaenales cyanobacterium]|nr:hypothetical protein [Pseudanabaenales cyanobacterium]
MQQDNTSYQPLTEERIRRILGGWLQMQCVNSGKGVIDSSVKQPTALLSAYYRLMEIYCTVKIGGVKGQIEAAQALLAREKAALEAEIAAVDTPNACPQQISLLKQEILELETSTNWRISQLKTIQTEEERAVGNCLLEIETALGFYSQD